LKAKYLIGAALSLWIPANTATAAERPVGIEKIQHIVVLYMENRSFDNLYGLFPGANGLSNAESAAIQLDSDGKPYATLPAVIHTAHGKPSETDARFPSNLPNKPFDIGRYVPIDQNTGDLVHHFYQNQMQINGGKNNNFVNVSNAGALTMGYYDGRDLPLWKYASQYTLADNFFQGAFGGSFLNHLWLICACTPTYPNAPKKMRAILDKNGKLLKDGALTPDGYAVNTIQPYYMPHKLSVKDSRKTLPPQTHATIGERLSEKNIDWAWYAGGWNDALSGWPAPSFKFHHQPFVYFSKYADGSQAKAQHLKDESDFIKAINEGKLPPVSFYKPIGIHDEHPGYADIVTGEKHIAEIIDSIQRSPMWKNTAIIVTYDENGGFWDQAAPPKGDRWGPGTRIPTIVISPFAKRGYVDHTLYNTTSILKFIETRFDLKPLGERDAKANGLLGAFDFK